MSEPLLGDRSLFPTLQPRAYLNHAAVSPPSSPVQDVVREVMSAYAALGIGALFGELERREALRTDLARLIGARDREVALIPNTTTGVIDVAQCYPWRPRDGVVVFSGEFPTNVTPWQRAAALHDLELHVLDLASFVPDPGPGLEQVRAALKAGTRVVAVSAVQFQTGLRMPLQELGSLCREHEASLFVDAIQACGIVPLDVETMHIDALSCGAHKWLMGLEGLGFCYVRQDLARRMRPHLAGWLSHEDPISFLLEGPGHLRYDRPLRQDATVFEIGASNMIGSAALHRSVGLLMRLGVPAIYEHVQSYLDPLEEGMLARGFESLRSARIDGRSGILALRAPRGVDVVQLHGRLADTGISTSIPDGLLRMAPHWPNARREVGLVLDAVDLALRPA